MQSDIKGIALCGAPGSGKTSIANELAGLLGWSRLTFAGPLKKEVSDALAYTGQGPSVDTRARMTYPGTKDEYRPLLQAWGSFFRGRDPEYWVKRLRREIAPSGHYVVDDCRYRNEYEMLRERGFVFVLLQSGPTTRPLTGDQFEHESERDWPDFDYDVILDYEPGPRLQAVRICQKLGLRLADNTIPLANGDTLEVTYSVFIEDALPEDVGSVAWSDYNTAHPEEDDEDCDGSCACDDCRPEERGLFAVDDCDGAECGHDYSIRFDPPYTGRVTIERVEREVLDVEDADDIVWAVPA